MAEDPKTKRRTLTVSFNEKDVTVRELSLRQFMELGSIVEEIEGLASIFSDIETRETMDIIKAVSQLLKTAPESLGRVISKATDLKPDEVLDGTIDEVLEIVMAIIKVNNFVDTFKKKVESLFPTPSPEAPVQE